MALLTRFFGLFLLLCVVGARAIAQPTDNLDDLRRQLDQMQQTGRLTEAVPLSATLTDAVRAKFGERSSEYAASLARHGGLLRALGNYREAETYYVRSRDLAVATLGPQHMGVSFVLNDLALVYKQLGRFDEADALYRQALAIREAAVGPEHPAVAHVLSNIAALDVSRGRYGDAETAMRRANQITDKALKPDDPDAIRNLNNLAALYWTIGRYTEAERLYKRALDLLQAKGPETPVVALGINNLAQLYLDQGRYDEAEPLFRRALDLRRKILPADHPDLALSLNNLAWMLHQQRRYAEALPLYEAALPIFEKVGPEHANVGSTLNNIAVLMHAQGRDEAAVPLFERAIAVRSKALGADNAEVGQSHDKLALTLQALGRYDEAARHYQAALRIREQALGEEHPDVIQTLDDIASLHEVRGDLEDAHDFLMRARELILGRWQKGAAVLAAGRDEIALTRQVFQRFVSVSWQLGERNPKRRPELAAEAFIAAQWAQQSSAEAALAQMAARQAKGAGTLSDLVRERQDLAEEWRVIDKRVNTATAQPSEQRDLPAEQRLRERQTAIEARSTTIDRRLQAEFPDFFALARPEPVPVAIVQANLRGREMLALLAEIPSAGAKPEQAILWLVTRGGVDWRRSGLGPAALQREVAALRCGVDFDGAWEIEGSRCAELTGTAYTREDNRRNKPLPFDAARAHALYKGLFGDLAAATAGRHMLVVPSATLAQLPLHLLVTKAPKRGAQTRSIDWLPRTTATTVLPAVSSLPALRRNARPSAATKPFLGVGNPLLHGPGPEYAEARRAAEAETSCAMVAPTRLAEIRRARLEAATTRTLMRRGGVANVAELSKAPPLPETAEELCAVGRAFAAADGDVLLGGRAREAVLKQLSADGGLANYRVLHFATHGALAGEVSGVNEPGLVLTPPETGSDGDDGYLSASEIAGMKVDADWVVLSACNTAAGSSQGGEALSGLARAFFYAGARALLVSHWYVDSQSTVALVTGAFQRLRSDPRLGRSEALRRSMLALIDAGKPPSAWAPFVVVGEGAEAGSR